MQLCNMIDTKSGQVQDLHGDCGEHSRYLNVSDDCLWPFKGGCEIQPSGYGNSIISSMLVMIAVNKGITLVLLAMSTRRERAPGVDLKGHQQGD